MEELNRMPLCESISLTNSTWESIVKSAKRQKYEDRRWGASLQDRIIGLASETGLGFLGAQKDPPPEVTPNLLWDYWTVPFLPGRRIQNKAENAKNSHQPHFYPTQVFPDGTCEIPDTYGATINGPVIPLEAQWVLFSWVDLITHSVFYDLAVRPLAIPEWPSVLAIRKGRIPLLKQLYLSKQLQGYNKYAHDWISKNGMSKVESKYLLYKSAWRVYLFPPTEDVEPKDVRDFFV